MVDAGGRVRGVDFISAPGVRSSRVRYVKTPLAPPRRRGLLGWIANLFGRRQRPFAGSVIAEEIDNGLDFSRRVYAGDPRVSLAKGSTAVESIGGRILGYATEATTRADNALDALDENILNEEHWLEDCRPDTIVNSLHGELMEKETETAAEQRRYTKQLVVAQIAVDQFKRRHDLDDDVRHGHHLNLAVIGQVMLLFLFEFVLNAIFQAGLMKDGLIGGLGFAGFTSMATIIVGLAIGIGVYLRARPVNRGGWFGWLIIAIGTLLAFLIVSELSLIRLAGDAGDLKALETSVREMSANPFAGLSALLELPALAYSIFIAFLIVLVTTKFLHYWGDYPGYWRHGLALEDAQASSAQLLSMAQDEIRTIGEAHKQRLRAAPDFIISCKAPIRALAADHENVIDQYDNDVFDICTAARLFDCFIGEQSGEAGDVLETRAASKLSAYGNRLHDRHAAFLVRIDGLCARENISDVSIETARQRFVDELDGAYRRLDQISARVLDEARAGYRSGSERHPATLAVAAE